MSQTEAVTVISLPNVENVKNGILEYSKDTFVIDERNPNLYRRGKSSSIHFEHINVVVVAWLYIMLHPPCVGAAFVRMEIFAVATIWDPFMSDTLNWYVSPGIRVFPNINNDCLLNPICGSVYEAIFVMKPEVSSQMHL